MKTCYIVGKTSALALQPSRQVTWNEIHTPYGGDGISLHLSNQLRTSLPGRKVEKHLHHLLFSHHQPLSSSLLQSDYPPLLLHFPLLLPLRCSFSPSP